VRSLEYVRETGRPEVEANPIFVYTHHSPNRQLKNYHLLERKMIEAKASKELHFIRPKDSHRIKKLFSDFSALAHQIIQKAGKLNFYAEFNLADEEPDEELSEA
jgi:hypothetical protein